MNAIALAGRGWGGGNVPNCRGGRAPAAPTLGPSPQGGGKIGAILLALLLLIPAAGWAKPPLDPPVTPPDPPGTAQLSTDHPGQLPQPKVSPPLTGVGPFAHLPSIDESLRVVLATRNKPYWQAGTFDPSLSNACALGDFVTAPLNRMVVVFTGKDGHAALQVVVPDRRHLLYDRRNLARPGETYFFKDASWPSCKVWIEGKVAPGKLNPARGTSLPKPDPGALKKKLKAIDGWPD